MDAVTAAVASIVNNTNHKLGYGMLLYEPPLYLLLSIPKIVIVMAFKVRKVTSATSATTVQLHTLYKKRAKIVCIYDFKLRGYFCSATTKLNHIQ